MAIIIILGVFDVLGLVYETNDVTELEKFLDYLAPNNLIGTEAQKNAARSIIEKKMDDLKQNISI